MRSDVKLAIWVLVLTVTIALDLLVYNQEHLVVKSRKSLLAMK